MSKLIWITGLSGSGKTTIGKKVYKELKQEHLNTIFLDGDNLREILGNDLGHTTKDRLENAKRIHRMCKFLVSQDMNVVCATMSLYSEIHELNRLKVKDYMEVFIECNINELIKRDQKSIYSKALKDSTINVVGVNQPYDIPKNCEIIIDNSEQNKLEEKVQKIINFIESKSN